MEDSAQGLVYIYDKKIVAVGDNDGKNNTKQSNFEFLLLVLPW